MIAGPVVILAIVAWLAGYGSSAAGAAEAAWVLLTSLPWALGWLLAAVGLGWPLRSRLVGGHPDALAIQVGLGVAAMITLDATLGPLGVLQWGGSLGAWAPIVIGLALLTHQLHRATRAAPVLPIVVWTAIPAVAVLLAAACSAPGWLWSSEFGGYDAMSYHLQLPAEWQGLGRIVPLEHNVYSWLPGYVEAAYYHLNVLIGDGPSAVYACQLLHASLAVVTAAIAARIAWRFGGTTAAAAAAVVVLGTPWTVVVGSLAYNEMAVALLLATGLLLVSHESINTPRGAAALGVLAAAACGAKLTGIGFAAAPLGVLLLASTPPRRWPLLAAVASGAGLACLLPWLVRNLVYCGNPVFPFATGLLGQGHWTPEQVAVWTSAHAPGGGSRLAAAWTQLFRYGLGANPDPPEPWLPQWSLLPWLAVAGLVLSASTAPLRRWSVRVGLVLVVQLLFWALCTHLKSRFMVPAAVPGAVAVALGVTAGTRLLRSVAAKNLLSAVLVSAALLWCCLPGAIYLGEREGAPSAMIGRADMLTGAGLAGPLLVEAAAASPTVYVNTMIAAGRRILLVGDATPLMYRGKIAYQTTWDRGPLSQVMRLYPNDPSAWLRALRDLGFTHLLVDIEMLSLWEKQGWNDPLITAARVIDAANRHAELDRSFAGGELLYRLR